MCPTRITVIRKLGSEKCIATRNLPLTSLTLKEPASVNRLELAPRGYQRVALAELSKEFKNYSKRIA